MSLARRFRRIVRAQLGALRGSSLEEATEPSYDDPIDEEPEPSGASAASTETTSDVPPEVAEAYRALEVPVGSDRKRVKTAYRRLMKQYHQDRFENDPERRATAGEVSKQLNVAYDRILEYLDRETG